MGRYRPTGVDVNGERRVRHGVARVLSKLGAASRTEAARWIRQGRVQVNGVGVTDPEFPVIQGVDRILVDSEAPLRSTRIVVMLNKPRGLVTTVDDEHGRPTVYRCLEGGNLPWLAPVGRLDKASEGLLLFANDPTWAARITDPATGPPKRYHVQINRWANDSLLAGLMRGVTIEGIHLSASSAIRLRTGPKNAWVELTLEEGRHRQIRRLLAAFEVSVLRLVRVAIGSLSLGDLPKAGWRLLSSQEMNSILRSESGPGRRKNDGAS